jgi:hypothetical protein
MINRDLLVSGLLSLGMMFVSGCAQKPAKHDAATPPSPQAAPAADSLRPQIAGGERPAAPDTPTTAALPSPLAEGSTLAPPASGSPPQDSVTRKQAAVSTAPIDSQKVLDAIRKMSRHPRVRYLSGTAQYYYYVGGVLDAKYDINKNELVITNDGNSRVADVTCTYAKDGKMVFKENPMPSKLIGECNNLITELTEYLAR